MGSANYGIGYDVKNSHWHDDYFKENLGLYDLCIFILIAAYNRQ